MDAERRQLVQALTHMGAFLQAAGLKLAQTEQLPEGNDRPLLAALADMQKAWDSWFGEHIAGLSIVGIAARRREEGV